MIEKVKPIVGGGSFVSLAEKFFVKYYESYSNQNWI